MIATLESSLGRALATSGLRPVDYLIRQNWSAVDLPPWKKLHAGQFVGTVEARVEHGRWLVDCPVDGCAGAQLASDSDRRFVCVECAAGPFEVEWPLDRDEIEAALNVRPAPNRNWLPGETVADLLAENAERGV
jgi:hypothetical protein